MGRIGDCHPRGGCGSHLTQGTVESYSPFISYLEVNGLIEHGEVDIAFIFTSTYLQGHDSLDMELLVAPQEGGATPYNLYLIVPNWSNAQSGIVVALDTFARVTN